MRVFNEVFSASCLKPKDFIKRCGQDFPITKASDFHEAIPCEGFPNLMYGNRQILKLRQKFGNPFELLEKGSPLHSGVSKITGKGYVVTGIDAHMVEHHNSHADDHMRVNWDLKAKRFLRVEGKKDDIDYWDYGVGEYMDQVFRVKNGEPYKERFEDKVRKYLDERPISDREFLSPERLEAHAILDQVLVES